MPKRTDIDWLWAQYLPSPLRGRGCLNRQIEAGEGALPIQLQCAAIRHRCSIESRGSRSGSRGNLAIQDRQFAKRLSLPNVARRLPLRLAALQHTRSRQCSGRSQLVGGTLRRPTADCAAFAKAVLPRRSNFAVTRASDLSIHAFSPYPLTRSLRDHPLPRRGEGQAVRLPK